LTILAVSYDKESLNRRKEELERAGHLIVPASSREAAMRFASEHAYDAALIGFSVPDADAFEISQYARSLHPQMTVVYVRDQHAGRPADADVVVRPGNADALLKALDEEI
jgi:DNA-binding NtrC family response regulator